MRESRSGTRRRGPCRLQADASGQLKVTFLNVLDGGLTLHRKHIGGVAVIVALAAFLLAELCALPARFDPARVAVCLDDAVSVVALVEGDDEEVFGAGRGGLRSARGTRRNLSAVVACVFDELGRELGDIGDVGVFPAAVQEEEDGEARCGVGGDGEGGAAVHLEGQSSDDEVLRMGERGRTVPVWSGHTSRLLRSGAESGRLGKVARWGSAEADEQSVRTASKRRGEHRRGARV